MAVRALRSTAGLKCVLVGMRQEKYVDDVLRELGEPIEAGERDESWQTLEETRDEILDSL
jgi:hypothetical protein